MKCEICHKANAATVLHQKDDKGVAKELYVCKACAKKLGAAAVAEDQEKKKKDGDLPFSPDNPPPFVKDFFKAAMGLVEGIVEKQKGSKTCPGCGCTWDQIKETWTVNCPRCYRTFAELIREEFLVGAYGRIHVGERPEGVPVEDTCLTLERELKLAVKQQKFEKAAELRRKLNALKKAAPPADGTHEEKA